MYLFHVSGGCGYSGGFGCAYLDGENPVRATSFGDSLKRAAVVIGGTIGGIAVLRGPTRGCNKSRLAVLFKATVPDPNSVDYRP